MSGLRATPPAVSVVVPVHDAADGLLGLTHALARQTIPPRRVQILLVDNGLTEAAVHWLEAHLPTHAELVHSPRPQNAYAARNVGIDHARAAVLAFTDADCRPAPDWLERGLDAVRHHRRAAGRIVVQQSARRGLVEEIDASRFLRQRQYARESFAATANLFIHRNVFDQVGAFDPRLLSGGDQEFGARAQAAGIDIAYAHQAVVLHPACRDLRALLAKAHRVGVGFGQALRYHSFERVGATRRIADRVQLMSGVWRSKGWDRRTRMALTAGHALLAMSTAVGCLDGYCRSGRANGVLTAIR